MPYPGPLRDEPVAVELHNTIYVAGGRRVDGLADSASAAAFVAAVTPRLGAGALPPGSGPGRPALAELRDAVRAAFGAVLEGHPPAPETLALLNATAARAPRSARVEVGGGGLERSIEHGDADRSSIVLASLATSAIELLTGPDRHDLRACGAPGCVLVYLRDHPRRRWCSDACGNRARQARHYARAKASP